MTDLINTFTSTGLKFFAHQDAMRNLRNGKGQPIVSHLMPTDICNHTCAFCSVQTREGDTLKLDDMVGYLTILVRFGLKAVIISGGGNPILYHKDGQNFNDLVRAIKDLGLEIGLITNGVPLTEKKGRKTWRGIDPETLDSLTWCRISASGLDHSEREVYVPEFDRTKTTLGFSYILHDIYETPEEMNHGKVSTYADVGKMEVKSITRAEDTIGDITGALLDLVAEHDPAYVRLLPNCLEPSLIPLRCAQLERMAEDVNTGARDGHTPAFVQYKPPSAPKACYLGYIHPVLNSDGYVYPCDSCVLNETANHKFANPWRVCHWKDVATIYESPVRSLIKDPSTQCPGCVFFTGNTILQGVVDGSADLTPPSETPHHVNFV